LLVIISDLHLWDGTIGVPISDRTFSLFASRLRELAFQASWRADGCFRPIETLDILLLGDILDPQQSSRWYEPVEGTDRYVLPWQDPFKPEFAQKLSEITRAIIAENHNAVEVFKALARGDGIRLPPADHKGRPSFYSRAFISPQVRIFYMVGNHDWYYRLPGPAFDAIRQEIVSSFALSNTNLPFPHDASELEWLPKLFCEYGLIARHGDIFDNWSFDRERGRNAATLADIFHSEVVFRFPLALRERLGDQVPQALLDKLTDMTSVHPVLAMPIWAREQINSHVPPKVARDVKKIWDDLMFSFLDLDEVHQLGKNKANVPTLHALRLAAAVHKRTTLDASGDLLKWFYKKEIAHERSIARFARREPDLKNGEARIVAYGHTHAHEVIALDDPRHLPEDASQVYVNTGTWGTVYNYATLEKNLGSMSTTNMISCLALYRDNERRGRRFETWWANF